MVNLLYKYPKLRVHKEGLVPKDRLAEGVKSETATE